MTATLVSIAAAMQSARDNNIMDAWRNGGLFEGQPATDDAVLAYWQQRLAGLDPKDPAYDTTKNNVLQLEYQIAESKQSTLYAQGKIDNAAMARFYLDWAQKVPPDSEFYRTLQRNAARFIQAVKSSAASGASSAAASARTARNQSIYNQYEANGDFLTNVFTALAQGISVIQTDKTLTNDLQLVGAPGSVSDPERLQAVVDFINQHPDQPLPNISDSNGNPVTGQQVLDQIRQNDPSFSGTLTSDYYAQALRSQSQGLMLRYQDAVANGTKTEQNDLQKQITATNEAARQAAVWDTAEVYSAARRQFEAVVGSTATPDEVMAAWNQYQQTLGVLANDPGNPVDDITRGKLLGEANLDPSMPTLAEAFVGSEAGLTTPSDNSKTLASLTFVQNEITQVASGQAVWAYGATTGATASSPPTGTEVRPGGSRVVAVPFKDAVSSGAQVALLPQAGAANIPIYVAPSSVKIVAQDANGIAVKTAISGQSPDGTQTATTGVQNTVGKVFDYWINGQQYRIYQYTDGAGTTRYTTQAPWGDGVIETTDPSTGAVTIDASKVIQAGIVAKQAGQTVPWLVTNDQGAVVGFNPQAVTDPIRNIAGVNESLDFTTFATAALSVLPGTDVAKIKDDPTFRQVVNQQALDLANDPTVKITSPFAADANGNPVVYTTAADKYAEIQAQVNRVVESKLGAPSDAMLPGQIRSFYRANDTTPAFTRPLPMNVTNVPKIVGAFPALTETITPGEARLQRAGELVPFLQVPTTLSVPAVPPPVSPVQPISAQPSPTPQPAPPPISEPSLAPPPPYVEPTPATGPSLVASQPGSITYSPGGQIGF